MPQGKSSFTFVGSKKVSMSNMDTDTNYIVKHAGCSLCRQQEAYACCIAIHRNRFSVGDYIML